MNIGSMIAYLKADTRQFDRNLERSQRELKTFSSRAVGHFASLKGSITALVRPLATLHGQILAFAGVAGIGLVSRSFIGAAREAENYQLRLNALLGSQQEGNRMFKEMSEFAGEVPFAYNEIMSAATQLSGIMRGGVEEISEWMPLIADLAAVSGLGIEKTTEQIVRMYSAGAASADMFRERGITAMLGFQAGVSYSAEETRKRLIAAWEDPQSKFRDATKDMAKSWDGLMSMIGDKWFQFRNLIMEAGVYDALKEHLSGINKLFGEWIRNNEALIRQKVPEYLEAIGTAAEMAWKFMKFLGGAVKFLWDLVSSLPKGFIDYLSNVARGAKKAEEELGKLNKTIGNIKPPPQTTFDKFIDFMGHWGKNIVEVFSFMGRSVAAVFGVMVGDAIATVAMIGKQFLNLADLIAKAMVLDFSGAKVAYSQFGRTNREYLKEIAINWEAYEKTIYDSWEDMLDRIEARMFPEIKAPEVIGPDLSAIDKALSNFFDTIKSGDVTNQKVRDWTRYWDDYWKSLKGGIELSKALASATENLHEEFRLLNITMAKRITPAADFAEHEANMKEFRENQIRLAQQAAEAERNAYISMYADLRWQAQDYFDFRMKQLADQAVMYEEATGNQLLVEQWLTEQIKQLLIERQEAMGESNSILLDLSQRTAEAMEQAFSDFFFDAFTSELKTWQDYFRAAHRTLSRILADILGQMVKDWLIGLVKKQSAIATEMAAIDALILKYLALARAKAAAGMGGGTGIFGFLGGGSLDIGLRQHGGPVLPNQPYIVGERGPELFVPTVRGDIISNDKTRELISDSKTKESIISEDKIKELFDKSASSMEKLSSSIKESFSYIDSSLKFVDHEQQARELIETITGTGQVTFDQQTPQLIKQLISGGHKQEVGRQSYQYGGWLNEPVIGTGLRTGKTITLGEVEPEYIIPKSRLRKGDIRIIEEVAAIVGVEPDQLNIKDRHSSLTVTDKYRDTFIDNLRTLTSSIIAARIDSSKQFYKTTDRESEERMVETLRSALVDESLKSFRSSDLSIRDVIMDKSIRTKDAEKEPKFLVSNILDASSNSSISMVTNQIRKAAEIESKLMISAGRAHELIKQSVLTALDFKSRAVETIKLILNSISETILDNTTSTAMKDLSTTNTQASTVADIARSILRSSHVKEVARYDIQKHKSQFATDYYKSVMDHSKSETSHAAQFISAMDKISESTNILYESFKQSLAEDKYSQVIKESQKIRDSRNVQMPLIPIITAVAPSVIAEGPVPVDVVASSIISFGETGIQGELGSPEGMSVGIAQSFQHGGWIKEPVVGVGQKTGKSFTFGETEPEYVIPSSMLKMRGMGVAEDTAPMAGISPDVIQAITGSSITQPESIFRDLAMPVITQNYNVESGTEKVAGLIDSLTVNAPVNIAPESGIEERLSALIQEKLEEAATEIVLDVLAEEMR